MYAGADPGFLKGGGGPSYVYKQKRGGPGGGPTLGQMLKSLHRGQKGAPGPPAPLDPPMCMHGYSPCPTDIDDFLARRYVRTCLYLCECAYHKSH